MNNEQQPTPQEQEQEQIQAGVRTVKLMLLVLGGGVIRGILYGLAKFVSLIVAAS